MHRTNSNSLGDGSPDGFFAQRSRSSRFTYLSILTGVALFTPHVSHARDMQGRFGLGYNAEFQNFQYTNGVPAVSIKYGLTRDLGVEGVLGVSTSSPRNSVVGAKFFKNIFYETNLNFYFTVGAASVSADSRSGAEFLGAFGAEAFIPGLESLGFAMETGASLDNLSGSFALKTLGVSFLNAGIHFYF